VQRSELQLRGQAMVVVVVEVVMNMMLQRHACIIG
jgi:hypothetical protein